MLTRVEHNSSMCTHTARFFYSVLICDAVHAGFQTFRLKVEPARIHRTQISSLCHPLVIKPATRIFTSLGISAVLLLGCADVQQTLDRGERLQKQYTGKDFSAQIASSHLRGTVV